MGTKSYAFFGDLAQFIQAENLKATGIGKDGARPGHEAVEATELADGCDSGPQIQVIGVAEQNLNAELFEDILGNGFDRCRGADGHKDGSFNFAVGRGQARRAGGSGAGVKFELE